MCSGANIDRWVISFVGRHSGILSWPLGLDGYERKGANLHIETAECFRWVLSFDHVVQKTNPRLPRLGSAVFVRYTSPKIFSACYYKLWCLPLDQWLYNEEPGGKARDTVFGNLEAESRLPIRGQAEIA